MKNPGQISAASLPSETRRIGRIIFFAFLVTFILARAIVYLIMSRRIPDLYLHFGQTLVHHLNYGIFLLSGVGAYLLFRRPVRRELFIAAAVYGTGLALTFDEFGMWLHLGGGYWQRASFDAVSVVGACLALVAFAPPIQRFRPTHWWSAALAVALTIVFAILLKDSLHYAVDAAEPGLQQLELRQPK